MQAAQVAIQRTLSEALTNAKIKNPSFSLRAFAKKLKINPSALSEILNGKRVISESLARRLVDNLALDPKEKQSVLSLFDQTANSGETIDDNYLELSVDHFKTISEWYHFAILSLMERSARSLQQCYQLYDQIVRTRPLDHTPLQFVSKVRYRELRMSPVA